MSDPMKQAWNDVAEGFSTLGRAMKERFQAAGADAPRDTAARGGTPDGTQDDGTALRDALDKLVAAGREFSDRAADVARDDEVKAQAKRAAAALNDAVAATVELIGDQVGGLFNRSKGSATTSEVPAPESPPPHTRGEGN